MLDDELPPLAAAPMPAPAAAPAPAPDMPDEPVLPAVLPVPIEPDPAGVCTEPDAEGVEALADEPVPELPDVSVAVLGPVDVAPELDEGELPEVAAPAPIAPPTPALVSLGLVEPLLAGALEPVPPGALASVAGLPAAEAFVPCVVELVPDDESLPLALAPEAPAVVLVRSAPELPCLSVVAHAPSARRPSAAPIPQRFVRIPLPPRV
ncbi:MAG TPA: hypothetical protein VFP65_06740 [Anaeromyxobacteraceae bacterium]|nr:hypothetical protein [Anaeromyxobacteraceae bacterium]